MDEASEAPPKSILIIGAGVFGLSTAYSLLTNPRYDQTEITILDRWTPDDQDSSSLVTPASIDNSRIVRPDYASVPYARLASLAQHQWRQGWPLTLPTTSLIASRLPINPAHDKIRASQPYRESGLLLTCSENREGLNPRAGYYVDSSLKNMQQMSESDSSLQGRVEVLATREDVTREMGTGGCPGDRGYANRASGWADAGAAMALLKTRTRELVAARYATGRAKARFVEGPKAAVKQLAFQTSPSLAVVGAVLDSGETLTADLTVLAAGASASTLLPVSLGPRIKATGQAMGYVVIDSDEAARLSHLPVPLDLSLGMFIFPPIPMSDNSGRSVIKVARHGWGYSHSETVPNTEPASSADCAQAPLHIKASFPAPDSHNRVAVEATHALLSYLHRIKVSTTETLHFTRTCWYADSATGEWLMDYVPRYGRSLFVATGDSGHGFKFAPVLGEWLVRAIEGRLGYGEGKEEVGRLLRESWRWRSEEENRLAWLDEGDGSRGGPKGMAWGEEIAKGVDVGSMDMRVAVEEKKSALKA